MHLASLHKAIDRFSPQSVIVDPISNLIAVGTAGETQAMLTRIVDALKLRGITTLMTSLTGAGLNPEQTEVGISSIVDTWLVLGVVQEGGERNRVLNIIKSRGMAHSNQVAEYRLTSKGIEMADTYLGAGSVLTGSARLAREAEDRVAVAAVADQIAGLEQERQRKRRLLESRISALREEFAIEDSALERAILRDTRRGARLSADRQAMGKSRRAFKAMGDKGSV